MKKYMLVMVDGEGDEVACFTNSWEKACEMQMNAQCGLGYSVEMYERGTDEEGTEQYFFLLA